VNISKATLSLLVLILGLAPISIGQSTSRKQSLFQPPRRELGYYDRSTGAFTPLQPEAEDAEAPAITPTTGTFVFTITITVKSTFPKNGIVGCGANAIVTDTTTGLSYGESASALATGSGTSWKCTVKIPYSWLLSSPTTDMVVLDYDVSIVEGVQGTATNGSDTAVEVIPARDSSHGLAPFKVPANGATTTETISVTL
jgi:hypothetical protein